MRLGFLTIYVVIMWALLIGGSFILIRVIAPIELESGEFATSIFKAAVALSMVAIWLAILIAIKNSYIRRKLAAK
ncbi:MAG: hypothetical protein HZA83_01015 [Thaumarchaeota archaeon]|nr:hypothetical protein [Nitrososphaerota archaeon]